VARRKAIAAAMDWADFDADIRTTLALSLITPHGLATPLLWLRVGKDELKDPRNDFEDLCLMRLKALLPEGEAVTILTDRSPYQSPGIGDVKLFKFLDSLGWSPESFELGVQPFEFDAGVVSRELPIGFGVAFVPVAFPGRDFFLEGVLVGDAAAEALRGQNGKFGFGSFHAWAYNATRSGWRGDALRGGERGVRRSRRMGAQVVLDQHDFFGGEQMHVG
jgi:hypothetical protein